MTIATAEELNGSGVVGVKVVFGREIRRSSLAEHSVVALQVLVSELFSLEKEQVSLKYKDEDGDLITLSLDKEVKEAVQLALANKGPLHLIVEVNSRVPPVQAPISPVKPIHDPSVDFSGLAINNAPPVAASPAPVPLNLATPNVSPIPSPQGMSGGSPQQALVTPKLEPTASASVAIKREIVAPASPVASVFAALAPASPAPAPPALMPAPIAGPRDDEDLAEGRGGRRGGRGGGRGRGGRGRGHRRDEDQQDQDEQANEAEQGGNEKEERRGRRGGRGGGRNGGGRGRRASEEERAAELPPNGNVEDGQAGEVDVKQRKREMRDAFRAVKETGDEQAIKEFRAKMKEDRKRLKALHPPLKVKVLGDLNIPDGSVLPPNSEITKTWRMKNTGEVAWPAGTQLIFKGRRDENGPNGVANNDPVAPSQEVEVSVTFVTPGAPGSYVAKYRLSDPAGVPFGKKVVVSFGVAADENVQMQ